MLLSLEHIGSQSYNDKDDYGTTLQPWCIVKQILWFNFLRYAYPTTMVLGPLPDDWLQSIFQTMTSHQTVLDKLKDLAPQTKTGAESIPYGHKEGS